METKDSFKILVVSDIHDSIENIKIIVDKVKDIKFDYIFDCGDTVDVPVNKNDDPEVCKEYIIKLKNIHKELRKLAPVIWVPGNHEPGIYFQDSVPEGENALTNTENLHKKFKKLDNNLYIVGQGGSVPIMTGRQFKFDVVIFKELNLDKDFKYSGYPYKSTPNDYSKSDDLFLQDLNQTIEKAKKEGGENVQILFLTHLGPLYTPTNTIVESGEILYLGSKNLGKTFFKEENGFLIVHGHSHTAEGYLTLNTHNRTDKHVFNPGSVRDGHYGILEIKKDKNGKWGVGSCTVAYL